VCSKSKTSSCTTVLHPGTHKRMSVLSPICRRTNTHTLSLSLSLSLIHTRARTYAHTSLFTHLRETVCPMVDALDPVPRQEQVWYAGGLERPAAVGPRAEVRDGLRKRAARAREMGVCEDTKLNQGLADLYLPMSFHATLPGQSASFVLGQGRVGEQATSQPCFAMKGRQPTTQAWRRNAPV
jgi:hypothetical protein